MFSRAVIVWLALFLVACGADPDSPTGAGSDGPYTLAAIGEPALTLHPGESRTLQALLAAKDEGPVANGRVHFAFAGGDAAGSRIDAADVATDDEGVASVHLTAGTAPAAFHVAATAPGSGAAAVAFAVDVVALRRTLRIVPTPVTSVSDDGARATTIAGVSSSVALKVRELDADTGAPIAGDTITFTLPALANAHWSSGVGRTATVQTGAGGKAQAFLVTTQAAEGPWRVAVASAAAGLEVTFDVTVRAGRPGDDPFCDEVRRPCPPGLDCVGGVCHCRDACPLSCAPGTHCQPAASCGEGSCVADESVPDVTGTWLTRHDFRIHDALPFATQEVFKALRLMDQTLLGQLTIPGLPGWLQEILNAFVARLLQQYLPGWMQQLIHVSDDLGTILGNLRSEGAMRLVRGTDVAHLRGTEVWTSLVFYWLPLCDGEIAGDPDRPPECARIDVLTIDSGADESPQCKGEMLPSISVELTPFNATLVKQGTGYVLQVDRRQARLTMRKVLLILYDELMGIVSGGEFQCIEEATACAPGMGCIVDCDGLGRDVESATDGIVDEATVQALCARGVRAVGELVSEALAQAWPIGADTLDFSGSATVSGATDDSACDEGGTPGTCAARLGRESWDRDLNSTDPAARERRDGAWSGDFFFRLERRLPGAWEATRPE